MSHCCLEPMELAALLPLPLDDLRHRAVGDCPRCDSLLREMTAFLGGDDGPPDVRKAHAERHLAAVLAGALADRAVPSGGGAGPVPQGRPDRRSRRGPVWGWGLGLAAAAAGIMFLVAREPLVPAGPSGLLRGGAPAASGAVTLAVTVSPGVRDGQVLLSWTAVAGADRYLVELFSDELDTLAVYGPLTAPEVAVEAALLRNVGDGGRAQSGVLCRVRALGAAGQVAVSRLTGLQLP